MRNSTYNGFINVLKPSGPSSGDIVGRIKRLSGGCKCGHFGTLDPLAAGVLPIALGKATKLFDRLALKRKKYRAKFKFGIETETGDTEGKITNKGTVPDINKIKDILPQFTGKIAQTPHNYSAIKIGGRKACDMARQGIEVNLKSREIEIYNIELINSIDKDEHIFDIECSAGTYIRSLCRDIAAALGTVGCMTMLIRLYSGKFDIKDSITLEEIEEQKNFDSLVLPITYPLNSLSRKAIDSVYYTNLCNGMAVKYEGEDEKETLVYCRDELFGIGNIVNNTIKVHINLK